MFDLFTGEIHIKRRHYQLIFNIVGAVSDADYSARKTLNRLVDTEKINIKLFAVAAENARNIAVIERIDKLIAGFSVHIPQWAVGFHCNSLAENDHTIALRRVWLINSALPST